MGMWGSFRRLFAAHAPVRWGFAALGGVVLFAAGFVVGQLSVGGEALRSGMLFARPTITSTMTPSPTASLTATITPSLTPTSTSTHTPTATPSPTSTPTSTVTPTPSDTPTPTLTGSPTHAANCDPAYPDVCIPSPPPDLDCKDIPYRKFRVLPPDPHNFDGDGNGLGCERP